jgi:hypothetical protein
VRRWAAAAAASPVTLAVVLVLALSWGLSLAWWAIFEPISAEARTTNLVIPAGTAEAVARGEPPPFIPNSLTIGRNGRVRVINQDVVPHRIGAWTVPPGGSAIIEPADTEEGVACTITPSGTMPVFLDRRPPITSTFLPAALLGLPSAVIVGLIVFVLRRIDAGAEGSDTGE